MNFQEATEYFKNDRIRELSLLEQGLRFLKLRSLSRKKEMENLISEHSINVGNSTSREWLEAIFKSDISIEAIDASILRLYEMERSARRENEDSLIIELYKIQSFEWGGLHQNSLERTIVDNYVKKITSYELLSNAIENELLYSMRSYVLASWYNHWTSIIIEDIFKDHEKVIPAIGLIKKIDFFVNNKPFDLKVTYLPEGFVRDRRKSDNLKPELTLMKKLCRELNIGYENSLSASLLIPDIWQKLDDHPNSYAAELIIELQDYRESLLNKAMDDPEILIRWLYENQGVRRFDASNRLFLILTDKNDFFNSWKLKRAKPLIQKRVNRHLNKIDDMGFVLDFYWEGNTYSTESDAIFVVKE